MGSSRVPRGWLACPRPPGLWAPPGLLSAAVCSLAGHWFPWNPVLFSPVLSITKGAGGCSDGLACLLQLPGPALSQTSCHLGPKVRPHLAGSPAQQNIYPCLNPKSATGSNLFPQGWASAPIVSVSAQLTSRGQYRQTPALFCVVQATRVLNTLHCVLKAQNPQQNVAATGQHL